MNLGPFASPGQFWRGNLHTHSTRSDGRLSPEEVCAFYRNAGYDFLALTDHFMERYGYPITDTRSFRTPEFTTIPGAELHTGYAEFGQLWHILAVGLPHDFAPNLPDETGPAIAARALRAGAFVAAAHPAWYGITEEDIRSLGEIHAIEVINGTSIDHNDKPDSWYVYDLVSRRGGRYSACATDDAHFIPDRHDTLCGWVHVKSESLDPEALVEALKAGNYYSSTGPQIHDIQLAAGDKLLVHCSPADRIWITSHGAASIAVSGPGRMEAEFCLDRFSSRSFRVTVRDASGGRAWSNYFWR